MGKDRLIKCLLEGKPYFGKLFAARQGLVERHAYMQAIVEWYSKNSKRNGKPRVLEIGSWAGMSTLTWVIAMRKYFKEGNIDCIDSWEPYFNLDIDTGNVYHTMSQALEKGQIYNLFQHNIKSTGIDDSVHILLGKSRSILPALENNTYDIVYIDGSHLFDDVSFDINEAKRIVKDGGLICGDDLEMELNKIDLETHIANLESQKDFVFDGKNETGYHPGVTEAVGRQFDAVALWEGFWAIQKKGNTWNNQIDLDQCLIELPEHLSCEEDELSRCDELDELAERVQFTEEGSSFNILKSRDRYILVSKSLGPTNLFDERIGEREIEPYVLIGATLDEIRQKAQKMILPFVEFIEEGETYNIVKAGDRYISIAKSLGPLNLFDERIGEREIEPYVLIGATLDEIRQKAQKMILPL